MGRKGILVLAIGGFVLSAAVVGADPHPRGKTSLPAASTSVLNGSEATAAGTSGDLLAASTADGPALAGSCEPAWNVVPTQSQGTVDNFLHAAAAVAPNDVWAVGSTNQSRPITVIEHWDGSSWALVSSPNVGGEANYLYGIDSVSSSNIWAVGAYLSEVNNRHRTLILHYDGATWTAVASPNVGTGNNYLQAVEVVSATNVWAVGYYHDAVESVRTLILHYDGANWMAVQSPNPNASGNYLYGLSATASNDVWAVGATYQPSWGNLQTLVLHYDGLAWTTVSSPNLGQNTANLLMDVEATSASRGWAVGFSNGTEGFDPVILKWDGVTWSTVPSGGPGGRFFAVDAVSANDVWAVGATGLFEHWDGTGWQTAFTPGTLDGSFMFGVTALPTGQVYATGYTNVGLSELTLAGSICEAQVTDTGFSIDQGTVALGATAAWNFPAANLSAHRINDRLRVFDSGKRQPGTSYTFTFVGAGTYTVLASGTTDRMTVRVPPTAAPPTGGITTQFTITWATATIAGYVFDVQVKRPGSQWADWKVGVTTLSSKFVPDSGTGQYSFRARIRNSISGKASGYSPPVTITVT